MSVNIIEFALEQYQCHFTRTIASLNHPRKNALFRHSSYSKKSESSWLSHMYLESQTEVIIRSIVMYSFFSLLQHGGGWWWGVDVLGGLVNVCHLVGWKVAGSSGSFPTRDISCHLKNRWRYGSWRRTIQMQSGFHWRTHQKYFSQLNSYR